MQAPHDFSKLVNWVHRMAIRNKDLTEREGIKNAKRYFGKAYTNHLREMGDLAHKLKSKSRDVGTSI